MSREQPAVQDILPELGIHQNSGKSQYHKATQSSRFNSYHFITIYSWSGHQQAAPKHPLNIFLHYYSFLSLTRPGFKKTLHLCNFSENLAAAYTFSLLPGIWQILSKVSLSTVTAAYLRGASIADGISHHPAFFSPVCPCTSSSFIPDTMAEEQGCLNK